MEALEITYRPTPVARQFIYDTRMVTGLFGPLETAKTTALCFKVWLYAQRFPGARVLIARDTYPNLIGTTQRTWFDWFTPGVAGEYHKTEKTFRLWTRGEPSEILFRSLDDEKDIKNVLSLEIAAAALDEPQGGPNTKGGADPGIDVNLYRSILGRIGRQKGYPLKLLFMCGNPPAPSHWTRERVRVRRRRRASHRPSEEAALPHHPGREPREPASHVLRRRCLARGCWVPFLRALPRDHVSGFAGWDWKARARERCANAIYAHPGRAREHVWTMLERLEGRAPDDPGQVALLFGEAYRRAG